MAYKKVIGNYQSNSDFTPGLVGYQITEGSITIFNSFYTTANDASKSNVFYETQGFSQAVSLSNLGITSTQGQTLLDNNLKLILNLDQKDLFNYTLFGSLREHIKSSITNIIRKWPASLYVNKTVSGSTLNTVLEYVYDPLTNRSEFKVPVSTIRNNFDINLDNSPNIYQGYSGIRMMGIDYYKYVIKFPITETLIQNSPGYANNVPELPIIGYTGISNLSKDYVYFKVKGNPFTGTTTSPGGGIMSANFHIKPNNQIVEEFFSKLKNLDSFLLNRETIPIFTSKFTVPMEGSGGGFIETPKKYTWPTTDGYNIDINTTKYQTYLMGLLELSSSYDNYKTDLVSRFFTTEAIKEFDTSNNRIQKLLRIYGREFDEVKRYIDGLAFANRVSYNKSNNIPDQLVKNFARTLGFETIDFNDQSNLLESFFGGTTNPIFSGTSVSMTPVEFDIELWRRLIVNAGYLFRSKGTRKIIEFFLKFIGAPESLIEFNEYVYTTKGKLDTDMVNQSIHYLTNTIGDTGPVSVELPMDGDGYPQVPTHDDNFYFQMKGGWYRETNTIGANSPHMGPYDGGQEYFDRFRCFTDISGASITTATAPTGTIPEEDLTIVLVSNELGLENNFNYIKNSLGAGVGLGYTNSTGGGGIGKGNTPGACDPSNPQIYCTWTNVNEAIQFGGGSVYVFEHVGEEIPANMQQLAKDLYDAGQAVLTISDYSQPSLYPITSVSDHIIGEPWGFVENPFIDALNPLGQSWAVSPSMSTAQGWNITGTKPEAQTLAYNAPPNETIINTVYLHNTNQGRWVHSQNPNLWQGGAGSQQLFTNIMNFLTMRTEEYRQYFNFEWNDLYEQEIYVSCPGFSLTPQIDNKKSWVAKDTINTVRDWGISDSNSATTNTVRDTYYSVGDSEKLVLNTKMVDAHINVAKGIEYDVYSYMKLSGFPITLNFNYNENINENLWPVVGENTYTSRGYNRQNLGTNFYYGSSLSGAGFTVSATTFAQYIDRLKTNFINVKNRKTIGGGGFGFQPNWPAYPTLRNLYESYVSGGTSSTVLSTGVQVVNNIGSNKLDYENMIGFMSKIEPYWEPLVAQFIPSTTIIGLGTKYSNTVFDKQKYVYKHGQHNTMEIEDISNSTMLTNPFPAYDVPDTLNNNTGSQWYNKTVVYSRTIGPGDAATETEPLILVQTDGTNTIGGVSTPVSALVAGGSFSLRIGVKFISGLQNIPGSLGGQKTYNIGGSIGCANNSTLFGPPTNCFDFIAGVGIPERQGKIFIKDAITAGEDLEILVRGPGFYEVDWSPSVGCTTDFKISTNINGLILDSVKLYRSTGAVSTAYIVDIENRNGAFTMGMEYDQDAQLDCNRMMHWRGLSGSAPPAGGTAKWGLSPGHGNVWPGTDGTESVTEIDWYERGLIDDII
tara:strand:- start:16469 stop:20674 length:4206 start_codon:yes stop_codon:yes gene_type:complete